MWLKSETYVQQCTSIRGSEHGAVILPRGTAVVECHSCVQADHVVLEEGVLIAQARVARQAGDMVLPGGGGVVFGLNLLPSDAGIGGEAVMPGVNYMEDWTDRDGQGVVTQPGEIVGVISRCYPPVDIVAH